MSELLTAANPILFAISVAGAVGLIVVWKKIRFRQSELASRTILRAEVVGHLPAEDGDTFFTEYRVLLPDGTVRDFKGDVSSSPKQFAVGDQVSVYYSATTDPTFIVGEFWEKWFALLVGLVAALGAFLSLPVFRIYSYFWLN